MVQALNLMMNFLTVGVSDFIISESRNLSIFEFKLSIHYTNYLYNIKLKEKRKGKIINGLQLKKNLILFTYNILLSTKIFALPLNITQYIRTEFRN
jgi:hypothetical protein